MDSILGGRSGSFADISAQKLTQHKLQVLADHDGLTGLKNRKAFVHELRVLMDRYHSGRAGVFGVIFLDFDRFKMINDSLGHDVGDGLLKSVASRLSDSLSPEAVIARFGGDEFAAIVPSGSVAELDAECERLLRDLGHPHQIGPHEIHSTASIGLVVMDGRMTKPSEMLCDADIAMYEAKRTGRGKVVRFDEDMQNQSLARQVLEGELIKTGVTEQMTLEYQPVHDIDTGALRGFESLVRWEHPQRGRISPEQFVTLAEECGAINHIGRWIFLRAVDDARALRGVFPGVTVNINVSRVQLLQPTMIEYAREIADSCPEITSHIVLEITESAFLDERVDIVQILSELKSLGYLLAIDDFGTGYSSLSCLHGFPVDILKIDRAFVTSLESKREYTAVFASIVSLANALELDVVAEGVETQNQLVQLQSMNCGYCQGYLFSKPLPLDRAVSYITEHRSPGEPGQGRAGRTAA